MPIYQAPVEDWLFLLNDFLRVQEQHHLPGYAELAPDLCSAIVQGAARFHEDIMLPVGITGDTEGAKLVDGEVKTPSGYRDAWNAYREAGWLQLSLPEKIGGAGLPAIMSAVVGEMRITTAHSLAMYGSFCPSAARMLSALGDSWIHQHIVPKLVSGEWTATMCLTESHCGTDLRQLRTLATEQIDGSWTINGTKIFISGGDHDLTENIIHIVLAKVPSELGNVSSDLSAVNVFVVSKRHIDRLTGELGESNGVAVSSIEHKMGIEGSATCVLNFEDSKGWRVAGGAGRATSVNMAPMFLLMNYARVSTALSGVGYAELACQNASAYARERLAGRAVDRVRNPELAADPIIVHPDIRRLLIGARSFAEGARATALRAAMWQAESESPEVGSRRECARDLIEVLTPVMKAYFTDKGFESANACMQVLGGHGYIREYGLEQMVRNARIGQIYEGANGIQAIDLVQRKLSANDWRGANTLLRKIQEFVISYRDDERMNAFVGPLSAAHDQLQKTFELLRRRAKEYPARNLAAAYDILTACGIIVVGWTWCEVVVAILRNEQVSSKLKRRKLAFASFWMEREMPLVGMLCQRAETDGGAILTLCDDEI